MIKEPPLLNKCSLKVTQSQFAKVRNRIIEDEGPTGLIPMISKRRNKFSLRMHSEYEARRCIETYYIDFYSEHAKTMFLMKYSEELS